MSEMDLCAVVRLSDACNLLMMQEEQPVAEA